MENKNFNNTVKGNNTIVIFNPAIAQNSPQNIDWKGTPWMERKPSCPEKVVTIGTSCSGIGAMEHALQKMGIKTRIEFAGDIDNYVKKSYFANYDITEDRWHNDLFKFAKSDLSRYKDKISIFMAGICCQPFSRASKTQKGIEDPTRGTLYEPFCEVIHKIRPNVWIMENVDYMLTIHKGYDWGIIKSKFDELGYDIHYQILNAKNYGIPQSRNRLFVIGFKEKIDFLFPSPIKLETSLEDLLDYETVIKGNLSPRMALRCQGFSDDFKMVVPKTNVYKQAGNSIAVPVLKAIFSQMDITKYGF